MDKYYGADRVEPPPKPGVIDVLPKVIDDLKLRAKFGVKKYGRRLQAHNGRDALMDAYQEALDLAMYLGQLILERDTRPEETGDGQTA